MHEHQQSLPPQWRLWIDCWMALLRHESWKKRMWWHRRLCEAVSYTCQSTTTLPWTDLDSHGPVSVGIKGDKEHYLFFVPNKYIKNTVAQQKNRFSKFKKIPGMRSFHSIEPINKENKVHARRYSNSESFDQFSVLKAEDKAEMISVLAPGQYIAAVYDDQWWLGMILEVDNEHDDYKVRFLHPAGPSPTFHWPQFDDECYIGIVRDHILLSIAALNASSYGRQYTLPGKTETEINNLFQK